MEQEKRRSPLIAEEDWWTVWFGLFILLVATALAMMTFSGSFEQKSVPKLGQWISSPSDVFFRASTTRIEVDDGTTLSGLADRINESRARASAEIVPVEGGVQLHVNSSRPGDRETITLNALVAGGESKLIFSQDQPDPGGLGARAYVSQVLPGENVVVGGGRFSVTAQRVAPIAGSLVVSLLGVMLLTTIGVRAMGQNAGKYTLAFPANGL